MDSKAVNREIKKTIWPLLKAAGFTIFTTRSAWRQNSETIDVLTFYSFNKYNSDVLGVETFSFTVSIGKYLKYVPATWPPPTKGGVLLPSEPECSFRGSILPKVHGAPRQDNIWSITKDGENLLQCIQDVQTQIPDALNWFERLEHRTQVLEILEHDPAKSQRLWGFGTPTSPVRSYLLGYVSLSLGRIESARQHFQKAVASNSFVNFFSSVEGAINRAL